MASLPKFNPISGQLAKIGGLDRINRSIPSDGLRKLNDVNGEKPMANLNPDAPALPQKTQENEKVREVARLYEKQFLREMTKAMRSTVDFGADKPSMGEGIYREQLDNEFVESWGDQGGIGLSDMIYNQMMERYFEGQGKQLKASGPIPLTSRDVTSVAKVRTSDATNSQIPLNIKTKPSPDGLPLKLQSPWDAKILSNSRINDQTSLTLEHPGGLKSTLVFKGVATAGMEAGKQIEKGRNVGILSPEANSFFWNIAHPKDATGEATAPNSPAKDAIL